MERTAIAFASAIVITGCVADVGTADDTDTREAAVIGPAATTVWESDPFDNLPTGPLAGHSGWVADGYGAVVFPGGWAGNYLKVGPPPAGGYIEMHKPIAPRLRNGVLTLDFDWSPNINVTSSTWMRLGVTDTNLDHEVFVFDGGLGLDVGIGDYVFDVIPASGATRLSIYHVHAVARINVAPRTLDVYVNGALVVSQPFPDLIAGYGVGNLILDSYAGPGAVRLDNLSGTFSK